MSGLVINEHELNAIEENYLLQYYSYACEIYKVMFSCGSRIYLHLKDPFLKFHLLCCILRNSFFFCKIVINQILSVNMCISFAARLGGND